MAVYRPVEDPQERIEFILKLAPSLSRSWVNTISTRLQHMGYGHASSQFIKKLDGLSDQAIERRMQALSLLPFLASGVMARVPLGYRPDADREEIYQEEDGLFASIDAGEPLIPAMRDYLKKLGYEHIKPAHIKRIMKLDIDSYQDLHLLDDMARSMDINAFPVTRDDYRPLRSFYYGICYALNVRMYGRQLSAKDDYFDALQETLFSAFKLGDSKRMIKVAENVEYRNLRDSLRWLVEDLIDPAIKRQDIDDNQCIDSPVFAFLQQMSFVDITMFNASWHKNWAKISREMEKYDQQERGQLIEQWQSAFPFADKRNLPELGEFQIVPLLSRQELRDTSEALDGICIDSYAPQCIQGKSFCFVIRDGFGIAYSAFELNGYGEIIQHEALGGEEPEDMQKILAQNYTKAIHEGAIKPNELYKAWQVAARDYSYREIYGYDKGDPDRALFAAKLLLDIKSMPKSLRELLADHVNWTPQGFTHSRMKAQLERLDMK